FSEHRAGQATWLLAPCSPCSTQSCCFLMPVHWGCMPTIGGICTWPPPTAWSILCTRGPLTIGPSTNYRGGPESTSLEQLSPGTSMRTWCSCGQLLSLCMALFVGSRASLYLLSGQPLSGSCIQLMGLSPG